MRSVWPFNPGEAKPLEILHQSRWSLAHPTLGQGLKVNFYEQRAHAAEDTVHAANDFDLVPFNVDLNNRGMGQRREPVAARNFYRLPGCSEAGAIASELN